MASLTWKVNWFCGSVLRVDPICCWCWVWLVRGAFRAAVKATVLRGTLRAVFRGAEERGVVS